jgi:hypothetical protein
MTSLSLICGAYCTDYTDLHGTPNLQEIIFIYIFICSTWSNVIKPMTLSSCGCDSVFIQEYEALCAFRRGT